MRAWCLIRLFLVHLRDLRDGEACEADAEQPEGVSWLHLVEEREHRHPHACRERDGLEDEPGEGTRLRLPVI